MKIGEIKKALEPLLDDAFESENMLIKNKDSQFIRRIYIRSVFAYIEGSIWVLKQVCLKAKSVKGKNRKINIPEFAILTEQTYDLQNNGNIKVKTKIINLLDSIQFTFKTINKLFKGEIDYGIGGSSWNKLIKAKNIRNRITHPKTESDMIVSDEEIVICEEVCGWFNALVNSCFNLFLESGKQADK